MRDLAKKRSALTATSQVIKVVCCSIARTNIGFGLAHVVEFCMNELTCVFFVSLHINVRRPSVLIQSSNRTSSHVRANMRVLSALTLAFVALHVCEGTYRKPYRSGSSHKKPKTLYQPIWNYRKYGIFPKMVKIFRFSKGSSLSRNKDFEFSLSPTSQTYSNINFPRPKTLSYRSSKGEQMQLPIILIEIV